MHDGKIHIPARQKQYAQPGQNCIIRIPQEAYNALVEVYNESTLSMSQIAGKIILQSVNRIVYDKEG